ncbi:hypothetical protein [Luedemannella helvata]|uniref:Uncharacterized protein n=1 Tax=Luedemannella helvata TaxID=349315 RepID=A0ABP4X455_9ACTN
MDAVTQLVTIAAVLLGGLTTYLTNYLTERSRNKQLLLTRWDGRRLSSYSRFIDRCRAEVHAAVLLYEVRNNMREDPHDQQDLLTSLVRASERRALAFERVMLVGGATVIDAAHDLKDAVARVEWQARGVVLDELHDWRQRHVEVFAAINRFHEAARRELGVGGHFHADTHSDRGLLLPGQDKADDSAGS